MAKFTRRNAAAVVVPDGTGVDASGANLGDGNIDGGDRLGGTGPILIDPASILEPGDLGGSNGNGDGSNSGKPKRSYTRRAGSGGPRSKAASLSVSGLETLLLQIHGMGAAILKTPEMAIDQSEAKMLAEGTANVLRHYPSVTMPAQVLDWIGLATCIGMIYGPRLVVIRNNRRSGRAAPAMRDVNQPRENVATVSTPPKAPSNDDGMIDVPGMPGVRILRPVQ